MVNDGQTIALGGLLLSNQSNGNRKVPFFGNIPVVGKALFTSNGVIFIIYLTKKLTPRNNNNGACASPIAPAALQGFQIAGRFMGLRTNPVFILHRT